MEHSAERGRKRKADDDGEQGGVPGSNATSDVVAGAWLTREKRARIALEVCDMNCERKSGPLLITTADLASTLGANALLLVGEGEDFRIMHRP
jgi:hypothetical protein